MTFTPHRPLLSLAACLLSAGILTAPAAGAQVTSVPPPQPPTPPPGSFTMTVPRTLHSSMPNNFIVNFPDEIGPTQGIVPPGTWWRNPETIKDLSLTTDQQKKLDDIFRQNRIQLVHMKASLEEEQINLEPMLNSNPPDQGKTLAEISRIADLRADLEKANARMLLALRGVLAADQWTKLQAQRPMNIRMIRNSSHDSDHDGNRHTSTSTTVTTCTAKDGQKPVCTTTHGGSGGGSSELNIQIPDIDHMVIDRMIMERMPDLSNLSIPVLPDLSKLNNTIILDVKPEAR